ncbi:hypothetical protein NE865_16480 [Phthorimaea operculella]|nr:hypothetical protein NE865_16480 [Phthorimaea operculella]
MQTACPSPSMIIGCAGSAIIAPCRALQREANMEKSDLVAARGYTKATITRLHTFVSNSENVKKEATEALIARKARLVDVFSQYEALNIKILASDESDRENVSEVEDKYYAVLTALNEEIKKRDKTTPQRVQIPQFSNVNLPPIVVPVFSDSYTAQAYQLERDTKRDPKLDEFLEFLEKRALALENAEAGHEQFEPRRQQAEPRSHQYKDTKGYRPGFVGKVANAAAAQSTPTSCIYYDPADGVDERADDEAA